MHEQSMNHISLKKYAHAYRCIFPLKDLSNIAKFSVISHLQPPV